MNHVDLFRRRVGLDKEISTLGGFVGSRDCRLFDAVQSGWYLGDSNGLFKGYLLLVPGACRRASPLATTHALIIRWLNDRAKLSH